jgi:TatD DNase family protein
MMILDTHCHIDLYPNPNELIQNCENAGITVLGMTNLPSHFEMGYPHVISRKKVRLALGFHPLYAKEHNKEWPLFLKNFSKTSYIGEIGLDFSREGINTREEQLNSFKQILELLQNSNKIVSLHSRRAEKEILKLLLEYNVKNAIFHWYSGPLGLLDSIAESGYYFSVNSAMTESENGIKIIKRIPLNRLLTETDGPFIKFEERVVSPLDIKSIEQKIAEIKNVSHKEISVSIKSNFMNIISAIS